MTITDRQKESIKELEAMLEGFPNIKYLKETPDDLKSAGRYISYLLALINSL